MNLCRRKFRHGCSTAEGSSTLTSGQGSGFGAAFGTDKADCLCVSLTPVDLDTSSNTVFPKGKFGTQVFSRLPIVNKFCLGAVFILQMCDLLSSQVSFGPATGQSLVIDRMKSWGNQVDWSYIFRVLAVKSVTHLFKHLPVEAKSEQCRAAPIFLPPGATK